MKVNKQKSGYVGIGVYHPKTTENIGTLWRSAHNFGADFIFTIGKRYKIQASDTTKAEKHLPLFEYDDFEDFKKHIPKGGEVVFIEQCEGARNLKEITHPKTAIYILGAEDYGVPEDVMKGFQKVFIDTKFCLNVAVAGSIVLYDRSIKTNK
jgi:tRNA (guanosine-2'-O-)-methyltransferase